MRLLFDEMLSHRLVGSLADLFPASVHVRQIGLESADDRTVWEHAAREGLTIVSKDADFHEWSLVSGPPPRVLWIRRGNCSTDDIEALIRTHHADIFEFGAGSEGALAIE